MTNLFYILIYILFIAVIIAVSIYIYKLKKHIDEMHGMMIGMTLGMISGLVTSTLFLIPTGNFLYGFIIGSVIGILFGIFFGKLGGHLGIMEGVIAGPMGGMMGAMLGQMVRPFSIEIFVPFFTFIFLITLIGVTYAVNCRVSCCSANDAEQKQEKNKISFKFIYIWSLISIFLLATSIILPFSINTDSDIAINSNTISNGKNLEFPIVYSQASTDENKSAIVKGDYQEIDLKIGASRYSPNIIFAKKGIPLKINLYADENAGCAREIIFPDFNIDKIVPAGGKEIIEINPIKEGEFKFRCSMDMIRGKLIVE